LIHLSMLNGTNRTSVPVLVDVRFESYSLGPGVPVNHPLEKERCKI